MRNVSVLHSPAGPGVIEVTFDQDYRSNNLSQRVRKRQYWIEDGGRWKIAYESTVGGQKLWLPESFPQRNKT
jgi:hypothetical protein